jgi:methylenetetrahydrofolate reductase (NADPH)
MRPDLTRGALFRRLAAGGFAVTAEAGPPRGAGGGAIARTVAPLRGWVDAVNVTDNQAANVRMASWAGSLQALAAGVEPVMQLTCRDRNRIALQSDLLGAAAVGIPNVLLMTGDHPSSGDHPDATPVFDLDGTGLLRAARAMREEGRLLSGRRLDPAPDWFTGAVENPFAAPGRPPSAARLGEKVAAGAQFVQTQYVFDTAAFARWMAEVTGLGLDRRCAILAGVGPVRSLRALDHLARNVPGVHVPGQVQRRLRAARPDRVADEGVALCAELIAEIREIPGVRGIHVMAPGFETSIPRILALAGLRRRDPD